MKKINKALFCFIILFVLISGIVTGDFYEPAEKNPLWKELWGGTLDPLIYFFGNFVDRVITIYSSLSSDISGITRVTYDNLEKFLLLNPNMDDVSYISTYFVSILEPLYVLAIIYFGFYLIFVSGSPLTRAHAKASLIKLLFSLILVTISPEILKVILSLSHGLTQNIISLGPLTFLEHHKNSVIYSFDIVKEIGVANVPSALFFILSSLFMAIGFFMILIARYFLVLFFGVLFPLAIFTYSFSITRNLGKVMLMQLFFWVFLSVSFAITFVAIAFGETIFHILIYELWEFDIAGTLALVMSPIGTYYATKWLGRVVSKFSKDISNSVSERVIPELKGTGKLSENEIDESLKELANRNRLISIKDLRENEALYRQLRKGAGEKELTLDEYIQEKYDFEIKKKKRKLDKDLLKRRILRQVRPKRTMVVTKGEKKEIYVNLGLKVKPVEMELKISKGSRQGMVMKVINQTPITLHNVTIRDQDLIDNQIFVDFSEDKFDLKSGEENKVKVNFDIMGEVKYGKYAGIITVDTKEGYKNFVDINIIVTKKEQKIPMSQMEVEENLRQIRIKKGKITLSDIEENEELSDQIKREAEEQKKTVTELLHEQYKIDIEKEERKRYNKKEDSLIKPVETRTYSEGMGRVTRFMSRKFQEKEKQKEEPKGKEIQLAPPAPEAPPKITRSL